MAKVKNKKPQASQKQGRNSGRTQGSGRGGRGRGRGGRGGHSGGVNDGGGKDSSRRQGGIRGGWPPPSGSDRGFGRGRGFGGTDSGDFMDNSPSGRPECNLMDQIDFAIQRWNVSQNGQNIPTPGGQDRGSSSESSRNDTSRGRGGRGGHKGHAQKPPPIPPLQNPGDEEHPLLQPIKFNRSIETATLFQEAEELLGPTVQCQDETTESHVPTADKVSRVFSNTHPHPFDNSLFEIEEGIEKVNFEEPMIGATADAVQLATSVRDRPMVVEIQTTITTAEPEPATILTELPPLYVSDTNPSTSQKQIEIPHRILDLVSVELHIRHFLANKDQRDMTLPACDEITREKIHNLAGLFGLKSKSKKGALGRYTTLIKTIHSGKNINEQEVARIMKWFGKGKSKEGNRSGRLKTKEGDVVGDAAPKIDETNIGFMMLASMGWSDGAAVGLSGGLDAPVTAVIKKTKLGLGASVSAKS